MKTTVRYALEGSSWLSVWWESIAGNPYFSHSRVRLLSLLSWLVCHVHWNQSAWTAPNRRVTSRAKRIAKKKDCKCKLAGKSKMEGCIRRRKEKIQIKDNDATTFLYWPTHHLKGLSFKPYHIKNRHVWKYFSLPFISFENDGMECLGWCF